MVRCYESLIRRHLSEDRQMVMLTGPRQVGKTTTARTAAGEHRYLSWDRKIDRVAISRGPDAVAEGLELAMLRQRPVHVIFDEIHKYTKWKTFLKGFFDTYEKDTRVVVTGSARLGFFRRGGDSLMGRYFLYRMHPLSLAELLHPDSSETLVRMPEASDPGALDHLLTYGGFPEPFLRASARFSNRWRRMRSELLFQEDLRDLTRTQEITHVEMLAEMVTRQVGGLANYSSFASDLSVSVDSVRRWLTLLESLFYCFRIRPWFANVPKSLRKQPKFFLWDWSLVAEAGARRENMVASHLLKAVHAWTDAGIGSFDLFHLRDKMKREVDFLVTRDDIPWFLAEVKSSGGRGVSPSLGYFQAVTGAKHAFQVEFGLPYLDVDAFSRTTPVRVPARTLLSQLV